MSTIESVDTAIVEIHDLEILGDSEEDEPVVAACQIVLDRLLDRRLRLPLQRDTP